VWLGHNATPCFLCDSADYCPMARILVLHGPNLNLLGSREPELYGNQTLDSIDQTLDRQAREAGHSLETFQSNAEHELIARVHDAPRQNIVFLILNPAALTHTSLALRDAVVAVALPFVEIHLSNIYARESYRQSSFFSDRALGVISGLGPVGYEYALAFAVRHIERPVP